MEFEYNNPWKTLTCNHIYDNDWINVEQHDVIKPNGAKGIYGKVHFKNYALGIIPVDEKLNTYLVGQYRYTLDEYSWEIPMGGGPLEIPMLESAARELKEETGLTAGKYTEIMKIHTSNSVTDETGFVFLAEQLIEGEAEYEDTEVLQIHKLPLREALQWVMDGRITDSLSVAGLLKVARLMML